MKTGIYCFTNQINSKKYVGQSVNIQDRINQHKYRYKVLRDTGYRSAFHSALRKYGWDNFSIEILEECPPDQQDKKEIYWIKKLKSIAPNGYNLQPGGRSNRSCPDDYVCPICGKSKCRRSKYCRSCSDNLKKRHCLHNGRKINVSLIEEILSSSMETVAKQNGYKEGNGLRKMLEKENIPSSKKALLEYYHSKTGMKHPVQLAREKKEENKMKHKEKYSDKPVVQYDLQGNKIKTYASMREAARETGVHSGHISECCSGKRKKTGIYMWKKLEA